MSIYLGTEKIKDLILGSSSYRMIFPLEPIKMLSSDNFIIKDINGVYVLPKEEVTE